jgi:hypothetical protein
MTQKREKRDMLSQHQQITADKVVRTCNANMDQGQAVVIRMDSKVHDKSIHLQRMFSPGKTQQTWGGATRCA